METVELNGLICQQVNGKILTKTKDDFSTAFSTVIIFTNSNDPNKPLAYQVITADGNTFMYELVGLDHRKKN